jgi:hypothetical protein
MQAALKRLIHASAPPRSFGQRLELAEGKLPRGLTFHNTNKGGDIYPASLHI